MTATYPVNSDYCANCNTIGDHRTAQCFGDVPLPPAAVGRATAAEAAEDVAGPLGGVTFTSRAEAIQRVIVDPIEASGEVADAWAEFDIDAIAAEVLGGYEQGFACLVDADEFWRIVAGHNRRPVDSGIR